MDHFNATGLGFKFKSKMRKPKVPSFKKRDLLYKFMDPVVTPLPTGMKCSGNEPRYVDDVRTAAATVETFLR